jgi:hypothetical protein
MLARPAAHWPVGVAPPLPTVARSSGFARALTALEDWAARCGSDDSPRDWHVSGGLRRPSQANTADEVLQRSEPGAPAPLRRGAERLQISMRVADLSTCAEWEQPIPSLASALANPLTILSPDDGWDLFNPRRNGVFELAAPRVIVRAGQRAKVEIGHEFEFPTECTKDEQTGKFEVAGTEKGIKGVTISIIARPTANPKLINLDLEAVIKDPGGLQHDDRYGVDLPQYITRRRHSTGQVANGSYLIIGQRDDPQTMETAVPVLGDIPLLGRLFRVVEQQKSIRLAAVQVIVSEATD